MLYQGATYRLGCKQCKCITGNDEYLHCTKCFYPPSPIWVTPARTRAPHTRQNSETVNSGAKIAALGTARCRDPISPVTAGARGSNLHTDLSKASRAVSHTPPHHTSRQLSAHYKDYEPWILNNKQLLAAKLSASQCKLITFSQGH